MSLSISAAIGILFTALAPHWWAARPPAPVIDAVQHEDDLLIATAHGLYREVRGEWHKVATRGQARGLADTARGTLIATSSGLYDWRDRTPAPRAIPLGAGARVRGVAANPGGTEWVASEVGLFARGPDESAFRRRLDLPPGEVFAVQADGEQVWVAARRALWSGKASVSHSGVLERRIQAQEDGWWELRDLARIAGATLLCVPQGIWRVEGSQSRRVELGVGELRAIEVRGDRLWVASARGLYSYDATDWENQVPTSLLASPAHDIVVRSGRLLVATRDGIAELSTEPGGTGNGAGRAAERSGGASGEVPGLRSGRIPRADIGRIQRAALAYLELNPSRIARLEERARRSALYPQLRAGLSIDRDSHRDRDRDEVLSSGEVRGLLDSERGRDRGLSLDFQLTWDFTRLATPNDALAVSRERRSLIEMRDQVLERIHRLYFERERVLERLRVSADSSESARSERREHDLRVRELTAQLDGWTGGLLTRFETHPSTGPGRNR